MIGLVWSVEAAERRNLITVALMTALAWESIQPGWLRGHRTHCRKWMFPNHPLWMRKEKTWMGNKDVRNDDKTRKMEDKWLEI